MEILDIVFQRSYQKGLIRDPKITYGEHIAIIDAIAKRDEDKAESLIRLHLRKSRQRVIEIIEKNII
jgi:DNA-binding GntR family transcriptional regulator